MYFYIIRCSVSFTPHILGHNRGMKYLEETEPIILSGAWSDSSHPDRIIKIYQFIDFIIFKMADDTIGSAKIKGIVGCGDILEVTWPQVISHQGRTSGAVHRTLIKVLDDKQLELVDDTVLETGKPVVHKAEPGTWVRKE